MFTFGIPKLPGIWIYNCLVMVGPNILVGKLEFTLRGFVVKSKVLGSLRGKPLRGNPKENVCYVFSSFFVWYFMAL
jgi:hypothetical protein